jgi:rhamnosyltransferase
MRESRVCAIVVTFHPDREVLENLAASRPQVDALVVVDNGSAQDEVALLSTLSVRIGFTLIENAANLGIAAALNQGVRWAQAGGFDYVLLFDQDSTANAGFVDTMLACFAASDPAEKLAILVPRYVDRRFGSVLAPPMRNGELELATTSGSMTPMRVFADAGLFAEELFIDGVDYEFSLRVRQRGWRIAECPEATLLHSPGTPTYHRLLGSKPFQAANYSPVRRYFQERNKIWVTRRYWRSFLPFCLGQFAISLKDLAKIVLVEQGKAGKIRYFFRGIRDGLLGRMGPFPGNKR